jgi:hypothetical protein
MQTKSSKLHATDYKDDVHNERKPADYDKKAYYDEDEVLEEKNPGSKRPEPERESEKNSDFQYHNRGNTHVETKSNNGRRQPHYKTEHSNRNLPQNRNRQSVRQEPPEQIYDGNHYRQNLPQTEESALPDQSDSYDSEAYETERPSASNKDQAETTPHIETTTEDRFPPPPPEFYEDFNKFKHIKNPFASLDFDFDAYLDKLRGNPSPASQQESSKVQITNTEPPEVNYHETEDDNIKSTTYQNSDSTTTMKPKIQQPYHTEPSSQRPSQGRTTEYIKEYYPPPPRNVKNVYNEEIGAHSEEDEYQKHNHQDRPADTGTETVKVSSYQNDHITTTTHTPQLGIATVNRHIKPHPLTVPFYPGEDGNFYVNPVHIQPRQPEATHARGAQDTVLPTDTVYKYSAQEERFDAIQSTKRIPYIISTSESYLQSHSNSNANNPEPSESTVTTPFPAGRDNADSLHSVQEVVTTPSHGSKPPRRGPIRNRPQNSKHIYASQSMETHKANDDSGKNAYYGDIEYHQQHVTKPRVRAKVPHTTPVSSLPHPFNATASSSNRYQHQGAHMPSTEFTPPRPLEEPAFSLTQSDTTPKKTSHSYIQASVEENDTIKPLKILKNERTLQSHKALTTSIYTSPIPSSTTEFLSTSSTTRYNDLETYNSWQSTVPYQRGVSSFELTTPTQPKHKVTDNNSESRFNSELELTTPSLLEYTTVKVINMHNTHSANRPLTYSGVQTSTRPSNELLDSIYDIAKTMFKPQYDTSSENVYTYPRSESAYQNPVTELIRFHPNITTTTISSTTHLKPRHRRPLNTIPRPPGIMNHVNKYTTSGADYTTPETYTTRHRPSKDHPSLPVRHRIHRPLATSLPNTAANVITTTTLPSNDIDTTPSSVVKSPSPTHSQPSVMPRRLRRPTKVRFDVTSTEAYADNDESESIERPLQHSVNRLNKIPLGSTMTAAPYRYSSK